MRCALILKINNLLTVLPGDGAHPDEFDNQTAVATQHYLLLRLNVVELRDTKHLRQHPLFHTVEQTDVVITFCT